MDSTPTSSNMVDGTMGKMRTRITTPLTVRATLGDRPPLHLRLRQGTVSMALRSHSMARSP